MKLDPYYSPKELRQLGFRALGRNVLVSRTCRIYTPDTISLGSHVLIDDFTILNGDITIGGHVHISSNCELYAGEASITVGDFAGISSRCALYATSDDFSGLSLNNPTVPRALRREKHQPVVIGRHVILGTGCTVLPGVTVAEGCAVACMTVVGASTRPWGVYASVSAAPKRIRDRERVPLELERRLAGV